MIGVTDLQSLVDEFLENHLARGNARGTLSNYEWALGRLVEVCPRLPVNPAHIREALKKPSWRKQTTRFLMYTHIRAFFNELERLYSCPNPCRSPGRGWGTSKRRVLSLEEMGAVYDATDVDPPKQYLHQFHERNQLIVLLIIECGPRVSEIANIRTWDVSDGWVCLDGKTGDRWAPVAREITDRMKALAKGDVVFMNIRKRPMTHRDVHYLVSGLQEKAGITGPYLGVPPDASLLRHQLPPQRQWRLLPAGYPGAPVAGDHQALRQAGGRGREDGPLQDLAGQGAGLGEGIVGGLTVVVHQRRRPAGAPGRRGPGRRTPCRGRRRDR